MDIQYLLFLQQFRETTQGVFNSLFLFITAFGEDTLLFAGIAAIYWSVNKQAGLYIFFNYHFGNYVNQFLKITACINRPWVRDSRVQPVEAAKGAATGYSFPSGHTAKATAVWGGLGRYIFSASKRIAWLLWSLVLLVGFSRNYLGVHTPQDVMVSLILGILLFMLGDKWFHYQQAASQRDWMSVWIGLAAGVLLILYAGMKSYPMEYVDGVLLVNPESMIHGAFKGAGGVCGFFLGWILERKAVHFSTDTFNREEKVWRALIGLAGLIAVLKVGPSIWGMIAGGGTSSFLNGLIPAFYIMGGFPFLYHFLSTWKMLEKKSEGK